MIPKEKFLKDRNDFFDDVFEKVPDPPPLDWERAKRIVYEGFRDHGSELNTSTGVLVDGVPDPLPWRLDLYNHSPTGLEWGYGGSGPHQLALAILAHATGDGDYARAKHWDYARQVTCRLARDGFSIKATQVLEWAKAHPISKEQRFNCLPLEAQGELIDRSIADEYLSECCEADMTYRGERYEGGRKSFLVCSKCGAEYEF